MLVTIHQPQFMPWLGYFDKMDHADLFLSLDTVQFKKNEWQNRNRVKSAQGAQWLTVPVRFRFPARIDEVGINPDVDWRHKHRQALRTNYNRAAHWETEQASLMELYERADLNLRDANEATIDWLAQRLGVTTQRRRVSDIPVEEADPTQRLVELCRHVGATSYLSGADGRNYLDVERFARAGIHVMFQEYEPQAYEQLYGDFVSHLSALDLILNHGPDSPAILRAGRRTKEGSS